MTVENGGEQPANDIATTQANDTASPQTEASENTEAEGGDETEGQEDGEQADADDIEIDVDGTKIRIARKVKEAIAKPFHQDYTRKTEELAQHRKAHQDHVESWGKAAAAIRSEEIKVAAIDERLEEYKSVDWNALFQTNPDLYHQHRFAREQLKEKREAADRALSEKRGQFQEQTNRESGERLVKAQAEIARHLPEWTPGGELDVKLQKYATDELKIPARELGETAIRVPQIVKELNRLRLYDEAAKKQKTTQSFQESQQAKPVTRVGAGSGSASRQTTNGTGDALTTAEWMKREDERVAKQRQPMGRR